MTSPSTSSPAGTPPFSIHPTTRYLTIESCCIDPQPRVDFVADVPGIGVTREFPGVLRSRVARIEVPYIAFQQPLEAQRHIAPERCLMTLSKRRPRSV